MRKHAWTDRDDRIMRVMHGFGDSPEAIARYLERTGGTILRRLRAAGLKPHLEHAGFTAYMDETIRINYPMWPAFLIATLIGRSASAVFKRAKRLGVKKDPNHWRNPMAHLWNATEHPNCVAARFQRGSVPPNKGMRRPGWSPGRMAETQFKKGQMYGAAQHNYVPIGTEKIDPKRQNLMRKITDDRTILPVYRWQPVHRLVWEAAHGPVPAGYICVFKPGKKTFKAAEITLDKLEVISLAENMRRNTIHNYPPELKQAMQMRGALTRAINRHEKRGSPA